MGSWFFGSLMGRSGRGHVTCVMGMGMGVVG